MPRHRQSAEIDIITKKTQLLVQGLTCDFEKLQNRFSRPTGQYKINQIKVSDRHLLDPKDPHRDWIPDELTIGQGRLKSLVKVYYNPNSPLLLTTSRKKLTIFDSDRKKFWPAQISFVPLPTYYKKKYLGLLLNEFVSIVGADRISVIPFDGCEHWLQGLQCKFCGGNPARLGFNPAKANLLQIKNPRDRYHHWWQRNRKFVKKHLHYSLSALLRNSKPHPHLHFMMMTGSLSDSYEWKIVFDTFGAIKNLIRLDQVDSYIILMPPKDLKMIQRAKKLGFRNISFNLECFNKKYFEKVCPGKQKNWGYDKIMLALNFAAKIFGKGNVRTNFVLGTEPITDTVRGVHKLAKSGIVSDFTVFFPRPASVWATKKPPTEKQVIDFGREVVKTYIQYGFKPFSCRLSSRSSIANELYDLEFRKINRV